MAKPLLLASAGGILWPMGGVVTGAMLIAWATEVLSFFLSRGFAFAVLALLQVLPEFAVEAVITWEGAKDPERLRYISANFTGANRLIVGLFLPMIFFVAARRIKKRGGRLEAVELPVQSSVEVVALLAATAYSFLIPLKGTLALYDAVILASLYGFYLWMVYRMPSHQEDDADLPIVARKIRQQPERTQKQIIALFFVIGGGLLLLSVHPFYENTLHLGEALGIDPYFLVQWLAPLLSEFPEFITVLYWAMTMRATLGMTNAVSSKVNQWTLLLAMVPLVYMMGTAFHGTLAFAVPFDREQRVEILLTSAQGLFAAACLMNLRFERWEAWALLLLWVTQLVDPLVDPYIARTPFAWSPFGVHDYIREWYVFVYLALFAFVVVRARARFAALPGFRQMWRDHLSRQARAPRPAAAP